MSVPAADIDREVVLDDEGIAGRYGIAVVQLAVPAAELSRSLPSLPSFGGSDGVEVVKWVVPMREMMLTSLS